MTSLEQILGQFGDDFKSSGTLTRLLQTGIDIESDDESGSADENKSQQNDEKPKTRQPTLQEVMEDDDFLPELKQ